MYRLKSHDFAQLFMVLLFVLLCVMWMGCSGDSESMMPFLPVMGAASHAGAPSVMVPSMTAGTQAPVIMQQMPASAGGGAGMAAMQMMQQPTMQTAQVTYNKDIRPIMVANCSMACHGADAATRTGPVALDSYASVKNVGGLVVQAVTSGKMPPWPPNPTCRPLRDTPTITEADRAKFTAWQMAGFPEGDAKDYVAPPSDVEAELGEPTRIVTMAQAHTPPGEADQYYCGLGDHTFAQDTYIRAIEVRPDQKATVHHVQVHIVSGAFCTVGDNIYSWRPGGKRLAFSEGDAALIPAGSSFALQMHYNTFGKTPMPDKTSVALWELPAGTKPQRVVTRTGVFALVPILPPGAVQSTEGTMAVGGAGVEIIGVSPHAHMIAKELRATLTHANGMSECLTDVPDWSFEWQMDYIFKDPLPLALGDTVNTECDYDNSPSHQPTVDGVKRQQPITVTQGEGSSDEMCLHYVWLRRPVN